jgi:hypothetical protein
MSSPFRLRRHPTTQSSIQTVGSPSIRPGRPGNSPGSPRSCRLATRRGATLHGSCHPRRESVASWKNRSGGESGHRRRRGRTPMHPGLVRIRFDLKCRLAGVRVKGSPGTGPVRRGGKDRPVRRVSRSPFDGATSSTSESPRAFMQVAQAPVSPPLARKTFQHSLEAVEALRLVLLRLRAWRCVTRAPALAQSR